MLNVFLPQTSQPAVDTVDAGVCACDRAGMEVTNLG
jgi:hypothetical protein